jgi:hypothetical protein
MKTAIVVPAVLLALVAMVNAQAGSSMGPQVLAVNKETLSGVGEKLGKDPIHFVALIKLKDGADVNKFVAVREAVAKKAQEQYKGVKVAYLKGALPAKQETLPQGAAKLEYWPLAVIVTAPDAKTYADYNAVVAKDPQYIESGKNVDTVVRAVNLQM